MAPPKLLPSGEQIKKISIPKTVITVLGLIFFVNMGLFRLFVYTGVDTYKAVEPEAKKAVAELKNFAPGAPGLSIKYGEHVIDLWKEVEPGQDYVKITGQSWTSAGSGGNDNGSSGTAQNVSDIIVDEPSSDTTQEQKQAQFNTYRTQFITLVGGADFPDFSMLDVTDVKTARELLARMKVLNVDVVAPSQWEAQLEDTVKKKYESCFVNRSVGCVRDWDSLQTQVLSDPPGLREWVRGSLDNDTAMTELVSAASNTNIQVIIQGELETQYAVDFANRRLAACDRVSNNQLSPIDIQWCYIGLSITIEIDEGYQLYKEVGGNKGKLDENDVITFVWTTTGGQNRLVVPYAIAIAAIPDMTIETTSYAFPPSPLLWDTKTNPWKPGVPLP